jgi:hypothetical protein
LEKEEQEMVLYVTEMGSDRTELIETLVKESVTFQECKATTVRETGGTNYGLVEIQANVPEVIPVPPEYTQGDVDVRAWRLPSGKLIISDMVGNLEQIVIPTPSRR